MIRKTTAFFIELGIGMVLMLVGAIILWHYSAGLSTPECIAIFQRLQETKDQLKDKLPS